MTARAARAGDRSETDEEPGDNHHRHVAGHGLLDRFTGHEEDQEGRGDKAEDEGEAPVPGIAPVVMPDMPAIRPNSAMTRTADRPMSTPPSVEASGVKGVTVSRGMGF